MNVSSQGVIVAELRIRLRKEGQAVELAASSTSELLRPHSHSLHGTH